MPRHARFRCTTLVVVLPLVVIACAGSDEGSTSATTMPTTTPATPPATTPATTTQPAQAPTTDTGCRTVSTGPSTYQYAVRPGTDPDLTSIDLYLPAGCGKAPVVIWVHGGGWRTGDKASGRVERKAAWAASLGAALVAVNYRLSTPDSGVRWPDHGIDVATAVAWVEQEGSALGLDTSRIVLLGHSAGAHLVAIVGTHPALLTDAGADPGAITCIVPLDGAFELAPARGLISNAFGTDPEVLADASPNVQIERNGPPPAAFLVVTRGRAGRVAKAQDFVDQIVAGGGSAQLLNANPYTHEQVNSELGAPDETMVTPTVTAFVEGCLT